MHRYCWGGGRRGTTTRLTAQEGQGLVEYGLILLLVAIAAVVALTALGGPLKSVFDTVKNSLIP
jgi:pilus assembly protein Flp/PilA